MGSHGRETIDWGAGPGLAGRLLADAVTARAREIALNQIEPALPFVMHRLVAEVEDAGWGSTRGRPWRWSAVDYIDESMFAWWVSTCSIRWDSMGDHAWLYGLGLLDRSESLVAPEDVQWWLRTADELLEHVWHKPRD